MLKTFSYISFQLVCFYMRPYLGSHTEVIAMLRSPQQAAQLLTHDIFRMIRTFLVLETDGLHFLTSIAFLSLSKLGLDYFEKYIA